MKLLLLFTLVTLTTCLFGPQQQPPPDFNSLGSLGGIGNGLGGLNNFGGNPKPKPEIVKKKRKKPPVRSEEEINYARKLEAYRKLADVKNINDFLKAFKPARIESPGIIGTTSVEGVPIEAREINIFHQPDPNTVSTAGDSVFLKIQYSPGKSEVVEVPKEENLKVCAPRLKIVDLSYLVPNMSRQLLWPGCIAMYECSGCCEKPKTCMATKTTKKNVAVLYLDHNFEYVYYSHVLHEHAACDCGCKTQPKDCNKHQKFNENFCSCQCNVSPQKCDSVKKQWSEMYCACVCKEQPQLGRKWNKQTCAYV